jgi:hypothetical protein
MAWCEIVKVPEVFKFSPFFQATWNPKYSRVCKGSKLLPGCSGKDYRAGKNNWIFPRTSEEMGYSETLICRGRGTNCVTNEDAKGKIFCNAVITFTIFMNSTNMVAVWTKNSHGEGFTPLYYPRPETVERIRALRDENLAEAYRELSAVEAISKEQFLGYREKAEKKTPRKTDTDYEVVLEMMKNPVRYFFYYSS